MKSRMLIKQMKINCTRGPRPSDVCLIFPPRALEEPYDFRNDGMLNHRDQRQHNRSDPVLVVAARHVAEKLPGFCMRRVLPGVQQNSWSESLQFEKIEIGEDLKIAAKVRVNCCRNERSAFEEQSTFRIISTPSCGVRNARHLLREMVAPLCSLHQL